MTPEQIKALQEAIMKELGTAVDESVKKALEEQVKTLVGEANKEGKKTMDDMKEEVKKMKESLTVENTEKVGEKEVANVVAWIFKSLSKKSQFSEDEGSQIVKSVVETSMKTVLGTAPNADNTTLSNLIFDQFHNDIIVHIEEDKFVSRINFTTITKWDSYTFINAVNGITTEYVEQASKGSASAPTFARMSVDVHKIYSQINITEEQYDQMTGKDIYALIVKFIAESQRKFIRREILTGNTKMTGILNLVWANTVTIGTDMSAFNDDKLIDIQGSIPEVYDNMEAPVHVMSKYVLTQLRKLRFSTGARMYPELRGANPTLDGEDVIVVKEASQIIDQTTDVAGNIAWVYGVLENAKAVRRQELKYEKGYVNDWMLTGIVTTVAKQRLGMKVINEDSFTLIKTA